MSVLAAVAGTVALMRCRVCDRLTGPSDRVPAPEWGYTHSACKDKLPAAKLPAAASTTKEGT